MSDSLLITVDTAPASDGWGFVGRVLVGDIEAYRTIRAHTTPPEALQATTDLLAGVLGPLLAGQEWHWAVDEMGHAPLRVELGFGLRPSRGRVGRNGEREASAVDVSERSDAGG